MTTHDPADVELVARAIISVPIWSDHPAHRVDEFYEEADAVLTALVGAGRLLPAGGDERTEWGVWWHTRSAEGIVLDEGNLPSQKRAEARGRERIGDYGIRGFTVVRRTHISYETGGWSTTWERVGEPWWAPINEGSEKP